jgi:hypothetical protein
VRAIQITDFGRPGDVLHVIDVPAPPSPGPFEVKVAVEFPARRRYENHSDLSILLMLASQSRIT